ncbi:fungal hydrophobin domain-containing protein [Penicillium frequentans]|nr:fungal hydrophobin domain-containing protein [Penicillium glabrum]
MKSSILLIAVSAGAALAHSTSFVKRDTKCPDSYVAQCCHASDFNSEQIECVPASSEDDVSGSSGSCSIDSTYKCCSNDSPVSVTCIDPIIE